MNRIDVIQALINTLNAQNYLEIGVSGGKAFLQIQAEKKVAVDPCFNIRIGKKLKWLFRNNNIKAKYYEVTSDEFFALKNKNSDFDVIFIDGLHTFEQTRKDVANALTCLTDGGVLIMHDCNPPGNAAAVPANSLEEARAMNLTDWQEQWCGDVWKTIPFLRSFHSDLNVFVLNCDFGLGVICRGTPESMLDLTEEEINNLTYQDLEKNRNELLNLKEGRFFDIFLNSLTPTRTSSI